MIQLVSIPTLPFDVNSFGMYYINKYDEEVEGCVLYEVITPWSVKPYTFLHMTPLGTDREELVKLFHSMWGTDYFIALSAARFLEAAWEQLLGEPWGPDNFDIDLSHEALIWVEHATVVAKQLRNMVDISVLHANDFYDTPDSD